MYEKYQCWNYNVHWNIYELCTVTHTHTHRDPRVGSWTFPGVCLCLCLSLLADPVLPAPLSLARSLANLWFDIYGEVSAWRKQGAKKYDVLTSGLKSLICIHILTMCKYNLFKSIYKIKNWLIFIVGESDSTMEVLTARHFARCFLCAFDFILLPGHRARVLEQGYQL